MMNEKQPVIELQNVKRYFQVGSETVKALRGVSFKIYEGEFVGPHHVEDATGPSAQSQDRVRIPELQPPAQDDGR